MTSTVWGIDISKKDFYVWLLTQSPATTPKKFTNNTQGFESLHNWLKQQSLVEFHACMEATSILAWSFSWIPLGGWLSGKYRQESPG